MRCIYSVPFLFAAPIIRRNSCALNVICDTADLKGFHQDFFGGRKLQTDLSQLLLAAPVEKYHLENTALSFALFIMLASGTVIKSKSMILDQWQEINS